MLNPNNTDRQQSQNQKQLSIGDRATHDKNYPFLSECSDLISILSIGELRELMTQQQNMFAQSIWEAENYGGSKAKCEKRLKEIHGPKWYQITSINDHMADKRGYYEFVLQIDHKKQWDNHRFWVNISEDKVLE